MEVIKDLIEIGGIALAIEKLILNGNPEEAKKFFLKQQNEFQFSKTGEAVREEIRLACEKKSMKDAGCKGAEELFWRLIGNPNGSEQVRVNRIEKLIVTKHFDLYKNLSDVYKYYDNKLYEALEGFITGVSDDGFTDFRAYLISLGKREVKKVLDCPKIVETQKKYWEGDDRKGFKKSGESFEYVFSKSQYEGVDLQEKKEKYKLSKPTTIDAYKFSKPQAKLIVKAWNKFSKNKDINLKNFKKAHKFQLSFILCNKVMHGDNIPKKEQSMASTLLSIIHKGDREEKNE